ncbi:MAG: DUF1622 domain-containing protein [Candidatus Limnocylindrales bacterium]
MQFSDVMETVARGVEVFGVLILVVGSLAAFVPYFQALAAGRGRAAYRPLRNDLGRAILMGLEILIVADIVQTITVDLTLINAATLGVIVLVRTFLSFSLEIELEGIPPWRRGPSRASDEPLPGESGA